MTTLVRFVNIKTLTRFLNFYRSKVTKKRKYRIRTKNSLFINLGRAVKSAFNLSRRAVSERKFERNKTFLDFDWFFFREGLSMVSSTYARNVLRKIISR